MAIDKNRKKPKIKLPVCDICGAVAKHYAYQCPKNPKNKCSQCGSPHHTSLMCPLKPRKPLRKESAKKRTKRIEVSQLWFKLNPPNEHGEWLCYLNISPECPFVLNRDTIRLEHVKSRARYPELAYDVNNLRPACDPCNKLKGSLDLEELPMLSSVRVVTDSSSNHQG